jgi:hypothetical protein
MAPPPLSITTSRRWRLLTLIAVKRPCVTAPPRPAHHRPRPRARRAARAGRPSSTCSMARCIGRAPLDRQLGSVGMRDRSTRGGCLKVAVPDRRHRFASRSATVGLSIRSTRRRSRSAARTVRRFTRRLRWSGHAVAALSAARGRLTSRRWPNCETHGRPSDDGGGHGRDRRGGWSACFAEPSASRPRAISPTDTTTHAARHPTQCRRHARPTAWPPSRQPSRRP